MPHLKLTSLASFTFSLDGYRERCADNVKSKNKKAESVTQAAAHDPVVAEFHKLVNMSPHALDAWLKTDESREVGWTNEGSNEAVGHASGRHIVHILEKARAEYSAADVTHMHKVVGYIKRHMAQGGPQNDKAHSRWAYSLKNWGHDPAN